MAYGPLPSRVVGFWLRGNTAHIRRTPIVVPKGMRMNTLKWQTFRIVMFLSVLASSSLVLMAGRRWGP